jgi:aspartokinase/homoserine dehydrogenase 1
MKIIKFGGSSIANPDSIKQVFSIIQDKLKRQEIAVIFSAFGGVTETLLTIAKMAREGDQVYRDLLQTLEEKHLDMVRQLIAVQNQSTVMTYVKVRFNELEDLFHGIYLIKENSPRTLDYVVSFGERLSAFILSEALTAKGVKSRFLDAREVIRTNDRFGQARVDFEKTNALIRQYFLNYDGVKVITGFIASTDKGETTTLGRSGSDYTAAIFA